MRRVLAIAALALPLAAPAQGLEDGAREVRPPVDRAAIRDALRAGGPTGSSWSSARAYTHFLQSRMAQARGDDEQALEEMRLAVIYDDEDASLRVELAWLYARLGDLDRAQAAAERAVELDSGLARAHLVIGKLLAAQHRRKEAEAALGRAIDLAPEDPEGWLTLARLHADFGAWKQAEAVARRFRKHHPRSGAPWRLLAAAAWGRADPDRSARYLRQATEVDPEDVTSRLQLARIERKIDPASAAARYEQVLRLHPSEPEALLGAGELALRGGDRVAARAYFRQLLGTAGDPIGAALQVAAAWRSVQREDDALEILDGALQEGAEDPRLHLARAMVLGAQGRHEEALAALGRIPPAAGALYAAALARTGEELSQLGRHGAAREAVRHALQQVGAGADMAKAVYAVIPGVFRRAGASGEALELLAPLPNATEDPPLAAALAEILLDLGQHREAQTLLTRALARAPGETRLVFALAGARERADDVDGAVGLMQALLRADPSNASALNFVGYVWADRGIRLDEACRMLEEALALEPEAPHILDSLGWCEVKRGNLERGVVLLEQAHASMPRDPEILHHLAFAYREVGREGEAAALWAEALRLLERDPDPRLRARIERLQAAGTAD